MIELLTRPEAVSFYCIVGGAVASWIVKTYVPWASPLLGELTKLIEKSAHSKKDFVVEAEKEGLKKAAKYIVAKVQE